MTQSAPDTVPGLNVLGNSDGILVAEWENICIAIWRKDSTMTRFNVQKAGLVEVCRNHPGKTGFLCVVEPTSGVPGDDVRKASGVLFQSLAADLRGIAMIIEGTGFRSAIVRSVASGIVLLMGKRETPISYFAHVDEGSSWLRQHAPISSIPKFTAAVRAARGHLSP